MLLPDVAAAKSVPATCDVSVVAAAVAVADHLRFVIALLAKCCCSESLPLKSSHPHATHALCTCHTHTHTCARKQLKRA